MISFKNFIIAIYLIVIPLITFSQSLNNSSLKKPGIYFDTTLSWDELRMKAKDLGKPIFIDVFATWCGPCKQMDSKIFRASQIGTFVNSKLLSIRLQVDTTSHDDTYTKAFYSVAKHYISKANITVFPTYLIVNSDGEILHRDQGYKSEDAFLAFISEGCEEKSQLYVQLNKFKNGDSVFMPLDELASKVGNIIRDQETAIGIAETYKRQLLKTASVPDFLTQRNLRFFSTWSQLFHDSDPFFEFVRNNADMIDSLVKSKGAAMRITDIIIAKDEIWNGQSPNGKVIVNWAKKEGVIASKFGKSHAKRIILDNRVLWYKQRKDWGNALRFTESKIKSFGLDTSGFGLLSLNNFIYSSVLRNSKNKETLERCISLMRRIVEIKPNDIDFLDTYATALYIAGNSEDAIMIEERALSISPFNSDLKKNLLLMQQAKSIL